MVAVKCGWVSIVTHQIDFFYVRDLYHYKSNHLVRNDPYLHDSGVYFEYRNNFSNAYALWYFRNLKCNNQADDDSTNCFVVDNTFYLTDIYLRTLDRYQWVERDFYTYSENDYMNLFDKYWVVLHLFYLI